MNLKVVFCWPYISGYMAACWRTLHQMNGIEVFVFGFQSIAEAAFSAKVMEEIPCRLLTIEEQRDSDLIKRLVLAENPDLIVISGWFHKPYRQLAFAHELQQTPFIMGMDTQWRGDLRQHCAPLALHRYLDKIDCIVVTGERSRQYARRLKGERALIVDGLYGIDYESWSPLLTQRLQSEWPQSFLFVGRYIPVKALDVLVEGYRLYRTQVTDPWPLYCCGDGPQAHYLEGQPGITNYGFLQPEKMRDVWKKAGALLMPSRSDQWPLALVEAAAAGIPIVCTDVCGSAVEVVRTGYNGLVIPKDNPAALAQALHKLHEQYANLPTWGRRSQQLAAPYAAQIWAERWQGLIIDMQSLHGKRKKA